MMDTPKANNRYLITEDNGATVRLMRFLQNPDGTINTDNDLYTLCMGEAKPHVDGVTLDTNGYRMLMSIGAWAHDEMMPVFQVLKVIEAKPLGIPKDKPDGNRVGSNKI